MDNKILKLLVASMIAGLFVVAIAAEGPDKGKKDIRGLQKTLGTPAYAILNINNLTTWHRHDGLSNFSPSDDNGIYFPRNTGNVIYKDCIVWGGKLFVGGFPGAGGTPVNVHTVRVGGGTYGIGTRAGRVIGTGANAVAQSPSDPEARIYRIRRDYTLMKNQDGSYTEDLRRDAADVNEIPLGEVTDAMMENVYQQYETDWENWPVQYGAPYIDRNNDGIYTAPPSFGSDFTVDSLISQGRDEPGIVGADPNSPADQIIWTVYNDLNVEQALVPFSSEPFGLEVQKTVWGYKRSDALGNLYFAKYKFINKGGVDTDLQAPGDQMGSFFIDSMYICQWSDPDLGNSGDDLVGCDTTKSLGFVYNGNAVDITFRNFSLPPPSAGYDFLAGPVVESPGDTAIFDLKPKPGFRNLGMSSFAYFSANSPYSDPPNNVTGGYSGTTGQWWKMLRGFAPVGTIIDPDRPYESGPFPVTKFPLSGDVATGTGFLDGLGENYSFITGDRRILLTTGPFQMAPGDTQEVVVGVVVGIGSDRKSSVTVMKFNDRFVQNTYDARFQVPKPPPAPDVKVAELDGEIVLEWSSNLARQSSIENTVSQPGNFVFEGYNVYQLPLRNSVRADWKRVATFDLLSDPAVILDEQVDLNSGQVLSVPVQFGANSGITRFFNFRRDHVQDIDKIYNGQEYYLVVTAYSRSTIPGYLPAVLESDPIVFAVRPKIPYGTTLMTRYQDTLAVTHQGVSDGFVVPSVLAPTRITGHTYTVGFDTTGGTWYLKDGATTLLSGQDNQNADDVSPVVDGIQWRVQGAPTDFKDFWQISDSTGTFDPVHYAGFGFADWPTSLGTPDDHPDRPTADATGGRWGICTGQTAATTIDYAYFTNRVTQGGARWPLLIGNDWEIRFTAGPNYGMEPDAFTGTGNVLMTVPFELWYLGPSPTDTSDDYRLFPYLIDNNANGQFDLSGVDNVVSGADNDPETDWFYWVIPKDKTPGQTGYNAILSAIQADVANAKYLDTATTDGVDAFRRMVLVNWNGGSVSDASFPANVNAQMPAIGSVFRILMTKPNTYNDTFTINTASFAPQRNVASEKVSLEKVGVFPNPYYAFNAAETNRFVRFVTFNNLSPKATIRIFNLAGQLVRRLDKDDTSQFYRWDLANASNFPVASGMYIAHLELTLGDGSTVTKVLKLGIIQEQEILNSY